MSCIGELSDALPVLSSTLQGVVLSLFYFVIFLFEVGKLIGKKLGKDDGKGERLGRSIDQIRSLLFADDNKFATALDKNEDSDGHTIWVGQRQ